MTIQPAQLITVKQAAATLGVEREAIERRLEAGRLKGRKERVLSRDVWFIYKSELDLLLQKKEERLFADAPAQTDFSPNGTELIVDTEDAEAEPDIKEQFELSLRLMSQEFSQCMERSIQHIYDLRNQLVDAESKLLLLTDMEKRAAEDRQLVEDKDAALAAAHERIASLQTQVENLSRPWWQKLFG